MEAHSTKASKTVTYGEPPSHVTWHGVLCAITVRDASGTYFKVQNGVCSYIFFLLSYGGISLRSYVVRVSLTQIATLLTRRKLGCVVVTWSDAPPSPTPSSSSLRFQNTHACVALEGRRFVSRHFKLADFQGIIYSLELLRGRSGSFERQKVARHARFHTHISFEATASSCIISHDHLPIFGQLKAWPSRPRENTVDATLCTS